MKTILFSLFILLFSHEIYAAQNCEETYEHSGAMYYRRHGYDDGTCYINAKNNNENIVYRTFYFSNDGLFMVFNSFGAGDDTANMTGAHVYYFFPRGNEISYDAPAGKIQTATAGLTFLYNNTAGRLLGTSRGQIKEDAEISTANQGGIEIQSMDTLYLDSGFKMGSDPRDRFANSVFHDANGNLCNVWNKDIYNYVGDEISFKFSDTELKAYLLRTCKNLKINF
jgi:hypothetical protein